MKRIALITLVSLIMFGLLAINGSWLLAEAATPATEAAVQAMHTANGLYDAAQYDQAAQVYEQLVGQGWVDSILFYNLGNAYYRLGDTGRAIVNFRRAQQLGPRDPDVKANLALARAQSVDRLGVADDDGLLRQLGEAVQSRFTLDEVAMAALVTWGFSAFLLILAGASPAGTRRRRSLQYGLIAVTVLLAVSLLALGGFLLVGSGESTGVIVAAAVDVTSGPGESYATLFSLHSGAEVKMLETRGSWVRLAIPGAALEGWVPGRTVEAVTG